MRVEVDGLVGKVRRRHSRRGNVIPSPPEWRGGPGEAGSTPGPGQEEVLGEMPVSALELLRDKLNNNGMVTEGKRFDSTKERGYSFFSPYITSGSLVLCFPSKLLVRQEQAIR